MPTTQPSTPSTTVMRQTNSNRFMDRVIDHLPSKISNSQFAEMPFLMSEALIHSSEKILREGWDAFKVFPPHAKIGLTEYPDGGARVLCAVERTVLAIWESPDKRLTLQQIYRAIEDRFPSSKDAAKSARLMQGTIRHALSLKQCFIKMANSNDSRRRGALWTVDVSKFKADCPHRRQYRSLQRLKSKAKGAHHKCKTRVMSTFRRPSNASTYPYHSEPLETPASVDNLDYQTSAFTRSSSSMASYNSASNDHFPYATPPSSSQSYFVPPAVPNPPFPIASTYPDYGLPGASAPEYHYSLPDSNSQYFYNYPPYHNTFTVPGPAWHNP
ncbi:hypothetical protein CVT24_008214 [Panaeolus cyanescens]|uniref:Fork-head domain-containing protein n=1 Tax=Panaeolus cyanescens TaxID=181874 RepID=A0A409VF21_9AGAR|nr:hypothetical protein CVT24_008214 [Panaeolus cyanescens]